MTRLDPALPTLALVLRHVAGLIGSTVEDIIADRGDADEARQLYCWLAAAVTEASPEAIGYAIALGVEAVDQARDTVDLRRLANKRFAERLDEAALEIHCEAAGVRRQILVGVPDRDAAATARRILGGERQALIVPVVDLVHLAASYELLLQRVAELDRATVAMLAATYTPGERAARERRSKAERALFTCVHPPASQEQPHG